MAAATFGPADVAAAAAKAKCRNSWMTDNCLHQPDKAAGSTATIATRRDPREGSAGHCSA